MQVDIASDDEGEGFQAVAKEEHIEGDEANHPEQPESPVLILSDSEEEDIVELPVTGSTHTPEKHSRIMREVLLKKASHKRLVGLPVVRGWKLGSAQNGCNIRPVVCPVCASEVKIISNQTMKVHMREHRYTQSTNENSVDITLKLWRCELCAVTRNPCYPGCDTVGTCCDLSLSSINVAEHMQKHHGTGALLGQDEMEGLAPVELTGSFMGTDMSALFTQTSLDPAASLVAPATVQEEPKLGVDKAIKRVVMASGGER